MHFLLQFAMEISEKIIENNRKKRDSDEDDPRTLDRYIIYGYIHIDIYTYTHVCTYSTYIRIYVYMYI